MSEGSERADKPWQPRRMEWALQENVLKAVIDVLQDQKCDLTVLARTIDGLQIIGTSATQVKMSLRTYFAHTYRSGFENGARHLFLADMRKQLAWLQAQPGGLAPGNFWRYQDARHDYEAKVAREKAK